VSDNPLDEALVRVRSLLVDLERHIDRGSAERDLAEVARAWVRAAQVERILRSVLPPEALPKIDEIPDAAEHTGERADAARAGDEVRRSR
jgi:hypothetical protein